MSWVLCFFFCVGGLNSLVVYYLLKKAGVEVENLLLGGLLALFSSVVCYDVATKDNSQIFNQRSYDVQTERRN